MKKYDVTISLSLTSEQKEEIERISKKRDIAQQQVIRMMIDLGIDCHKDLEKVGIIKAIDFSYYVKQALKKKISGEGATQLSLI